jgi:hypothetical protein
MKFEILCAMYDLKKDSVDTQGKSVEEQAKNKILKSYRKHTHICLPIKLVWKRMLPKTSGMPLPFVAIPTVVILMTWTKWISTRNCPGKNCLWTGRLGK